MNKHVSNWFGNPKLNIYTWLNEKTNSHISANFAYSKNCKEFDVTVANNEVMEQDYFNETDEDKTD